MFIFFIFADIFSNCYILTLLFLALLPRIVLVRVSWKAKVTVITHSSSFVP